jgi:hypothetical protein
MLRIHRDGPRAGRRKAFLLLATAGMVIVYTGTAGAAGAAGPSSIEGVWSFNGGQIAVQHGAEGTFVGTVVAATQFAECVHPVGQEIWKAMRLQPNGSYWGGHQWYLDKTGCKENPTPGPTAWRIMEEPGGAKYLEVCFSEPGAAQPMIEPDGSTADTSYGCVTSAPIAPLPTSGVSSFVAKRCSSGRRFQIHLAEPKYDPFKTIRVTLRSRRLPTARKGRYVIATINLKGLPPGSFTVEIAATTVLGRHLTGSRTYHTCTTKPKHETPGRLRGEVRPSRGDTRGHGRSMLVHR